MNFKQAMLDAICGRAVERIPWAPRLDLWHKANKLAGTLPREYANASLIEVVDGMGAAMHAIVPDFKDLRSIDDEIDRGIGIYNLKMMPCRTVLENVDRIVSVKGDRTHVEYRTPAGTIATTTLYDESMRKAGITITITQEHAVKSARDYEAMGHIFANARVEPNYEGYAEYADLIGDRGLASGFVGLAGSPMHLIQRELMHLESFFYEMHDRPDELATLAEKVGLYWQRVFQTVLDCPAEVVFVGANYDASVTYPPFFAEHIQPALRQYSRGLRAKGKYLLTHTDGENSGLLEHYLASEVSIADSICPKPMTKLTFKQVRDVFKDKITIMGGIPSVSLLKRSMSDERFEGFLDEFFEMIGRGDHLILGISDTTPPGADFGRIIKIKKRIESFQP